MYRFDVNNGILTIDTKDFVTYEYGEESILLEPTFVEVQDLNFTVAGFPKKLMIEIHSETGFDTYLFHELHLAKTDKGIKLTFYCLQPNKYWEGVWGLSTFLATLHEIVKDYSGIEVGGFDIERDWKEISLFFLIDQDFILRERVNEYVAILKSLIKETKQQLSGVVWRKEYETDEKLFCTDVLYPLFRKMKFIDVHYTHGQREYGKDFTFSEQTSFGNLRHYGLQAKAGNIRGNVNSEIDELIGQLNDAFSMPYHEVSANETRRISTFIIAISGLFTENAKDKIAHKISDHFKGAVYFLDRDKIQELIERYWFKH